MKRLFIVFALMLALNTFFASLAYAEGDENTSPVDSSTVSTADTETQDDALSEQANFEDIKKAAENALAKGEANQSKEAAKSDFDKIKNAGDELLSSMKGNKVEIKLTASPEGPTVGPVTITVQVTNAKEIKSIKWLPGNKKAKDFKSAGNEIDPANPTFQVEENGTYTVYVQSTSTNPCGLCQKSKQVQTITIDNINKEEPTPTPEPEPTPEPTPTPTPTPVPTPAPVQTPAQATTGTLKVTPVASPKSGNTLPQTATEAYNIMAAGFLLIVVGMGAMAVQRKLQQQAD